MRNDQFARTTRLIGEAALERLQGAHVSVIGLGGVGGHAANALCRAGVGSFLLLDGDVVEQTNINRQAVARHSTLGQAKVEVMKADMLDINPGVQIQTDQVFLNEDNLTKHLNLKTDFILDCIDSISCKAQIAKLCYNENIPIISAMGAGNRTQAEFVITDIFQTQNDPVAKIMRRQCRQLGIRRLPVVWSCLAPQSIGDGDAAPASISFVPPAAGLKMAEYVVNQLIL